MKTEVFLFIVLAILLIAPLAMADEGSLPSERGFSSEDFDYSRASFDEQGILLARKDKRRNARGQNGGIRDNIEVPGNPHPNGKDKIVSGIVISSIGGGIGVGLMTYALYNPCYFTSYDEDGYYDAEKESRCKRTNQFLLLGGIASTAIGLGIGLPKMFDGIRERKVWKQWNRDNARKRRRPEFRTVYQYNFFLAPDVLANNVALGLRFRY